MRYLGREEDVVRKGIERGFIFGILKCTVWCSVCLQGLGLYWMIVEECSSEAALVLSLESRAHCQLPGAVSCQVLFVGAESLRPV